MDVGRLLEKAPQLRQPSENYALQWLLEGRIEWSSLALRCHSSIPSRSDMEQKAGWYAART